MTTTTLPASYDECETIEQRWAWMRERNRERCEAAAARKAAEPKVDRIESFELNPPVARK